MKKEQIRIYLDDKRQPAESAKKHGVFYLEHFNIVRNIRDFQTEVRAFFPDVVSLDHDLTYAHYDGDYSDKQTGYDALVWLLDYCDENGLAVPEIRLHTANEEGEERMRTYLNTFKIMRNIT